MGKYHGYVSPFYFIGKSSSQLIYFLHKRFLTFSFLTPAFWRPGLGVAVLLETLSPVLQTSLRPLHQTASENDRLALDSPSTGGLPADITYNYNVA
jgi:hypothetical protein